MQMKKTNIAIDTGMTAIIGLSISLLLAAIVINGAQHMSRVQHQRASHDRLTQLNVKGAPQGGNACAAQRPGRNEASFKHPVAIKHRQTLWL
jgi:D-serine dehydratase